MVSKAVDRAAVTRLVLVRHGEGHANVDRVHAGLHGCAGLTTRGRRQVTALAARWRRAGFRPDALVHSPVRRARETTALLAAVLPGAPVIEDCALCEPHLGEADGLTWEEYGERYGALDLAGEPTRPFAPGAESWSDVLSRVPRRLAELAAQHPGRTVVVVTHAGFIVASLLRLLAIPTGVERAYLDPGFASLTTWRWSAGRWTLETFNDTAHLPERVR